MANTNSDNVLNWRNRTKEKLIEYKGGKCEKCGYCNLNYLRVFEFHHKNPSLKDFTISGKSWSYEKLQAEVDKCIMLCSNCHKELHEDLDRNSRAARQSTERPKGWRSRTSKLKPCFYCNTETKNAKFCSQECVIKHNSETRTTPNKPSKEELFELKKTMNNIQISKLFSVSEATIRDWYKDYSK